MLAVEMRNDPFSRCHPAVNFLYFVGAIGFGVVIQHPAYLLAGAVCAACYYLLLSGKKGWRMILGVLPMFIILTAINPLFNTQGQRILFRIFGRPYTLEALTYGAVIAAIFVVMMLWFGCYNAVMTSDKFTSLFGNLLPSISLLLVMAFRMVPNLIRKAQQLTGARKSIGKGAVDSAAYKEKLSDGMIVLGALTSWVLEGSVITGDSMRARGYGTAKRSSFMIYRMTVLDWLLLAVMLLLVAAVITVTAMGGATAAFTPEWYIAPISGINMVGIIAYCFYSLIPTVLHIKEAIQWHISRSRI